MTRSDDANFHNRPIISGSGVKTVKNRSLRGCRRLLRAAKISDCSSRLINPLPDDKLSQDASRITIQLCALTLISVR